VKFNKRIELTTKAEPIFSKYKVLGGFCVSSSLALSFQNIYVLDKINILIRGIMNRQILETIIKIHGRGGIKMSLKEKIENNITVFLLGTLVTGFLAGIGTYKAILEIAKLEVVSEGRLNQKSDSSQLEEVTKKIIQDMTNRDMDVETGVKYALAKIGKPAITQLIVALKAKDKNLREMAALYLGEMQAADAVDALIYALQNDDEPYVMREAARALGEIGNKKSVKSLRYALKDNNSLTREGAAYALGKMKAIEAQDDLINALKNGAPNVKVEAARALGKIQAHESAEYLLNLLNDKNSSVRSSAAYALGMIKYTKAVDALIIALEDYDKDVKASAARALGKIGDPSAVDALIIALEDYNKNVKTNAAGALGKIGDTRAIEPLKKLLTNNDLWVRNQAEWALKDIQGRY